MSNFYKLWKSFVDKKTLQENVDAAESALQTSQAKLEGAKKQKEAAELNLKLAAAEVLANKTALEQAQQQAKEQEIQNLGPAKTGTTGTTGTKMEEVMPAYAAGNPSEGAMGKNAVPYQSQDYRDRPNMDDGPDNLALEEKDCGVYEGHDEAGQKCYMEIQYEDVEQEKGCGKCEACMEEKKLEEAKYQGRSVPLNKPMKGDVKKFKVYVKDPSTGNVKKVNFGDKKMRIKKNIPARRKSFRARHHCANPGPKTKARYWSCRKW